MDEKDRKSLTVDDILDQLVKPSVLEGPVSKAPAQSTLQRSSPFLDSTKSAFSPKAGGNIKLPALKTGTDPKPAETIAAMPSLQPSEIKLSVRTMADDINRLREGGKPMGLEISRILDVGEIQKDQKLPQTIADIPSQTKLSEFKLPSAIKAPLPPTGEHLSQKSSISSISTPLKPGTLKPAEERAEERIEYKAIAKVVSSGMATGVLTTIVAAIAIYFLLSTFVFNQEDIAIPTPAPINTTTNTTVPEANELETIFNLVSETSFLFPESNQETISKFKLFVNNQPVDKNQFKRINFSIPNQTKKPQFGDILNRFLVSFPIELTEQIKDNNIAFLYGQQEIFGEDGKLIAGESAEKRLVFIVEVKNKERTLEIVKSWELTMPNNLKDIFDLDISKQASLNFLDNKYQGIDIRYKNFPLPDRSIDYAVITSFTGRYYLLMTNSRESMYSPANKILGIRQ